MSESSEHRPDIQSRACFQSIVRGRQSPAMRALLSSSVVRAVPVREPACARPKGGCARSSRVTRCQTDTPAVQCNRRVALAAAAALTLVSPGLSRAAPAFGASR